MNNMKEIETLWTILKSLDHGAEVIELGVMKKDIKPFKICRR